MKHIRALIKWILLPLKKLRRRWIIAKAYPKVKKAFEEQQKERTLLKKEIMLWLREFFGVDANSKYIPKDYKNKAEVEVAIKQKYGQEMERLNMQYSDMFK